ncbi:hypothetical protein ID0603_10140 [Helicobacter pylori]
MAISEWQMLFNKIKKNIGSPFGVIKEVFFYDYSPNNPNNSPQLKQFLEYKCHFIGFVETFIGPKSHDFGKELDSISVELSNPNTFIQSLLKLGSFLHGKTIKFFDNNQTKKLSTN